MLECIICCDACVVNMFAKIHGVQIISETIAREF